MFAQLPPKMQPSGIQSDVSLDRHLGLCRAGGANSLLICDGNITERGGKVGPHRGKEVLGHQFRKLLHFMG